MEPSINATTTEAAPAHPLKDLLPARKWVELHGHPVFPSYDSFDWFVRQHQPEFASCPDWIVTGRGRFCGPGMASFVRGLLDKDSRESMQRLVSHAPAKPAVKVPRGRPRKAA
jgi:hypothetical protein